MSEGIPVMKPSTLHDAFYGPDSEALELRCSTAGFFFFSFFDFVSVISIKNKPISSGPDGMPVVSAEGGED